MLNKEVQGGLHQPRETPTPFDRTIAISKDKVYSYEAVLTGKNGQKMSSARVRRIDREMEWQEPIAVQDTPRAAFTGTIQPRQARDSGYLSFFSGIMDVEGGGNGDPSFDFFGKLYHRIGVEVTVPDATKEGDGAGFFSVRVIPERTKVLSYRWFWKAPEGAGHDPVVNFADATKKSTNVRGAHWFAIPNSRIDCSSRCFYEINCEVEVEGGLKYTDDVPPTWEVLVPMPMGKVDAPTITGFPEIRKRKRDDKTEEWYVTGIGSLRRNEDVAHINLSEQSDFLKKATIHEDRHVKQWKSIEPWCNLFDARAVFERVKGWTSTTTEAS